MPAASCKNNGGSWVSRTTAPCSSVRIRFISSFYFQILTNYFSRKPFTMTVIQNAGGNCHIGTNQPDTAEASSKPFLPCLITLPRPCHVRRCAVALRCQPVPTGTLPIRLCSKLRNPAPPRTLVRSTTYAVRGRRLQIPARRRFDCSVSYCCLSRGIGAVNRPVPRRCRTLFSLRERPWHTRKPYLGKHRPAPIRQKIR
jgi:hypothetical protein